MEIRRSLLCFVTLTVVSAAAGRPGTAIAQPPSPEAAQPESAEVQDTNVRAFRAQVSSLYESASYAQLDALAQQLRTEKLRFRGGVWQLNVFYTTISFPGPLTSTDAEWEAQIARLQQWMQASPNSPTPRIALAQAYIKFAWKARGNGFGNTVTPEGWALFKQRIESARSVLEAAQPFSVGCPEWYRQMQTVALAQGWPRKQVDALASQAMAHEPEYFPFALAQANYLLPKWYGKPGETEQYAAEVADTVGGQQGDALYFLIAESLNCCRRTQAPALSSSRVQQGFTALDQLYGTNNFERNAAAYMALRAGDTQTAQALFTRIGNDWERSVWHSKALFDASRTGQTVGETKPLAAKDAAPVAE